MLSARKSNGFQGEIGGKAFERERRQFQVEGVDPRS
jgi:hypothetical protein